jgi:transcriptional regulator with XRE-family HTH domain
MTDTHGSVRGGSDTELAAKLGRAIREALGDEMSQSELARITGIDQPTLSKLIRGVRTTPLTVWEMLTVERATRRPPGWILVRAGITRETPGAREAIKAEPGLPVVARRVLLAGLEAAKDTLEDADDWRVERVAASRGKL